MKDKFFYATQDETTWFYDLHQKLEDSHPVNCDVKGIDGKPRTHELLMDELNRVYPELGFADFRGIGKAKFVTFKKLSEYLPCFPFNDKGEVVTNYHDFGWLDENFLIVQSMLWACPKWKLFQFNYSGGEVCVLPGLNVFVGQFRQLVLTNDSSPEVKMGNWFAVLVRSPYVVYE